VWNSFYNLHRGAVDWGASLVGEETTPDSPRRRREY
jgi:hypothetical protein